MGLNRHWGPAVPLVLGQVARLRPGLAAQLHLVPGVQHFPGLEVLLHLVIPEARTCRVPLARHFPELAARLHLVPGAQLRPEMEAPKLLDQVARPSRGPGVRLRPGLEASLHPVPEARQSRGPGVRQRQVQEARPIRDQGALHRQVPVPHRVERVERLPA